MRAGARVMVAVGCVILPACVPRTSTRLFERNPTPSPAPPVARIYLVGDAGVASFEKGDVPAAVQSVRVAVAKAGGVVAASAAGQDPYEKYLNDTTAVAYRNLMNPNQPRTLMRELRERIGKDTTSNKFVLFPGDNVYQAGIPKRPPFAQAYNSVTNDLTDIGVRYVQAAATVLVQARLCREAGVPALFVPGNHDWDQAGPKSGGAERVKEQHDVLAAYGAGSTEPVYFQPADGCMGPGELEAMKVTDDVTVRIISIDTEAFIKPDPHCAPPQAGSGGLSKPTIARLRGEFSKRLADELGRARTSDVNVVVAHHPVWSHGEHGGFVSWSPRTWRGALLGRIISKPLPRLPLDEDLYSSEYSDLIEQLTPVLATPPARTIYATGHDHSLQILRSLRHPRLVEMVSGSASKLTPVGVGPDTLLAAGQRGYFTLSFAADGSVAAHAIMVDDAGKDRVSSAVPLFASSSNRD